MKRLFKIFICLLVLSSLLSANVLAEGETDLKGTQRVVVIGDDWGAVVSKTIIEFDNEIDSNSVNKDSFKVTEVKPTTNFGERTDLEFGDTYEGNVEREVTAAYTSDDLGNEVTEASKYVTLELYYSPTVGGAFNYDFFVTGHNDWYSSYSLNIVLSEGKTLTSNNNTYATVSIMPEIDIAGDDKITPQLDVFTESDYSYENISLKYASYSPADDSKKNALVIWLHGAGEGGADTAINLLGNEVTVLVGEEFQNLYGGAYVLAPQTPTMWMDDGTGEYQAKGESMYGDALWNLITSYVDGNSDIDLNRIIIGGCSNGGYMTMEMIIEHPEYFAAAFPICEAYDDASITDEQIKSLINLPIWFTYATNDTTVDPTTTSIATINRLKEAGSTNVHVSEYANVVDTTGRYTITNEAGEEVPYEYMGHWSWLYFFNNDTKDENGKNAWEFLSEQTNGTSSDNTMLYLGVGAIVIALGVFAFLKSKKK